MGVDVREGQQRGENEPSAVVPLAWLDRYRRYDELEGVGNLIRGTMDGAKTNTFVIPFYMRRARGEIADPMWYLCVRVHVDSGHPSWR